MSDARKKRAVIVSPVRWDAVHDALEGIAEVERAAGLSELRAIAAEERPDLVLVDIAAYREALNSNGGVPCADQTYVVTIAADYDPAEMRLAMRAGARDFLMPPFTAEGFDEVFRRASAAKKTVAVAAHDDEVHETRRGKVLTFFTTKGGSGKSTLATNFATALAESGHRVCMLDLDLQFGDLAMIMNIKPRASVVDVISEDGGVREDADGYLCECRENLLLLAAPPKPEEAEMVRAEHISALIEYMRPRFDYIVVDTAASFNDTMLAVLDGSDKLFLIVTPLILSLKNLKRVLDVMTRSLGYGEEKISVVLNRSDSPNGIGLGDIEKICGRKIDYLVPSEGNVVVRSINDGVPAVATSPRCKFSIAVRAMADTASGAVAKPQAKPGLFAALFGGGRGKAKAR